MAKLTKAALQRKKPVEDELLIPADDAQAQVFEEAKQSVSNAEQRAALDEIGGTDPAEAAKQVAVARDALDVVKDQIRKTGTAITLRGIGRLRWDELFREHPPTEAQKAADKDKPEHERDTFDPVTYWPALLAETADSDLTADDWQKEVFGSRNWGPAELDQLRNRAAAVNASSRILELGN